MNMNYEMFEQAKHYIPGGVNSPVRSFNAVGGTPFFTDKADGAYLYDIAGNRYIDYVCSWGANIVGHARHEVVQAITDQLHYGLSYGTPTALEVMFAKEITQLLPSIEKLRLVSSGTEAVMSALRLARGYTQKKYIVKFIGCYHGHCDALLVKAGSGLATLNNPSSAGILPEAVEHTLLSEYNDVAALEQLFNQYGKDIACIILEPFCGNMNLVRPSKEFLDAIVKLCRQSGSLLIFDEVMTGFRVALGGAQHLLNIKPDLTILGKVIGGGMPLAAFGGRADIMDELAPLGRVYQAGTLSGNPIAVTSGLATLKLVQQSNFYVQLNAIAKDLTDGMASVAKKHKIPFVVDHVGGMFGFYFCDELPTSFALVQQQGGDSIFNQFFHAMLANGVYFAPSRFEAGFVSIVHDDTIIKQTIAMADKVFSTINL
jgi:glutamate-1-semialdehyde 2,1-aminomutase